MARIILLSDCAANLLIALAVLISFELYFAFAVEAIILGAVTP